MSAPEVLLSGAAWVLRPEPLAGAAVLLRDGRIADIGPAAQLRARHADAPERDLGGAWLVPGMRNAHGHVAGWPADAPVEVFLLDRYATADEDAVYRAVLRTALLLLGGGVTSTHHLHYGPHADAAVAAYRASGIRVEFCLGALDRYSVLPYDDANRRLLEALPPELAARAVAGRLGKPTEPVSTYLRRWRALRRAEDRGRVQITLGPDNPQWCTDECLAALAAEGAPMHLHVQETARQRSAAVRSTGMSPVQRLARLGVLRPDTTLAHLTSADDADIELVASADAAVAVNASSNLRLGSGIAPLRAFVATGLRVGLGSDGGGVADDLDPFAEVRLAAQLQRVDRGRAPELDSGEVFALGCGRLDVGSSADVVVLAPPGGSGGPVGAVVARTTRAAVRDVYVGGEPCLLAGVPTRCVAPGPEPPAAPSGQPSLAREVEPFVRALLARECEA